MGDFYARPSEKAGLPGTQVPSPYRARRPENKLTRAFAKTEAHTPDFAPLP